MKLEELRISDTVRVRLQSPQGERLSVPMDVVGLFEPDSVYLDFDGNEGDVWEEKPGNLVFDDDDG